MAIYKCGECGVALTTLSKANAYVDEDGKTVNQAIWGDEAVERELMRHYKKVHPELADVGRRLSL